MGGRAGQAVRRGLHRVAWAVLICAVLGAFLGALDQPAASAQPAPAVPPAAAAYPPPAPTDGQTGTPTTGTAPKEREDPKPGTGLLGDLDKQEVNGAPISAYEITGDPGGAFDWDRKLLLFLTNGIFGFVKLIIGVMAWLLGWALKFGPAETLLGPVQVLADVYKVRVVDTLGLPSLLLTLAGLWCGLLILRGRGARGWGEMGLSVLVSAVSATTLLAPANLLMGNDGLMGSTRDTAISLASITATAGGSAETDPSARMKEIILKTFIAEPHQMLQFGAVLEGNDDVPAKCWQAYKDGISGKEVPGMGAGDLPEMAQNPFAQSPAADRKEDPAGYFMEKAKGDCKEYVDYHAKPSWDRLFGALLLLLAAGLVAVLILIMVGVLLISICAMACYAITGHIVAVIAILPGGARGLLWRWLGGVAKTVLVICAVVVVLPLMAVGIDALMRSADEQGLMVKFALMDVVVAAALVFHRRLLRMSNLAGRRLASRMEWAKIGGSRGAGSGYSQYGLLEQAGGGGGGYGRAGGHPLDSGMSLGGAYRNVRAEIDRVVSPVTATAGKARRMWVGDQEKNRAAAAKQKDGGAGVFKQKMYGSRGGRALWRTTKATRGALRHTVGAPVTWAPGSPARQRTREVVDDVRTRAVDTYGGTKQYARDYAVNSARFVKWVSTPRLNSDHNDDPPDPPPEPRPNRNARFYRNELEERRSDRRYRHPHR
ncbi:hypothetical protein OHR68_00695 [Spirillospora sp. NBC_00431]